MTSIRLCLLALAVAALAAAGCGADKTDVSEGVEALNKRVLAPQGAELDCPDTVDGGEGATFECTMKATKGDASAPVTLKIVEQDDALAVDVADQAQYEKALAKVTRQ